MTPHQEKLLCWVDVSGIITPEAKLECPGIHFCPDWDYLPVCDASPEKVGCKCKRDR